MPEFQTNEALFQRTMKSIFNFMSKYLNNKKDGESLRGIGFIALGKISLLLGLQQQFEPYLEDIFSLIDAEIKKPAANSAKDQYVKPIQNTDVLYCIRDLARHYGHVFERRYSQGQPGLTAGGASSGQSGKDMKAAGGGTKDSNMSEIVPGVGSSHMYEYIASLFYFGFKRPLIEALKELSKIGD